MDTIIFFLLLNIAIEFSVVLLLIKKPYGLFPFAVIAVNLFTWPLFIYIISNYPVNIYLAEIIIFIVEGSIYSVILRKPLPKMLLISFLANLVSYLAGYLFNL